MCTKFLIGISNLQIQP